MADWQSEHIGWAPSQRRFLSGQRFTKLETRIIPPAAVIAGNSRSSPRSLGVGVHACRRNKEEGGYVKDEADENRLDRLNVLERRERRNWRH